MNFKDYYKILGVTYDASQNSIENAYNRERANVGRDISRLSDLNEAYNVLSFPSKRAQYDKELVKHISSKNISINSANTSSEFESAINSDISSKESLEPVVERTPEVKASEPVIERTPEVKASEPVVERTPEVKASEPVVERTPEVEPSEPVVERTPEVKASEPVIERTPEVKASEPVIERTPEVEPSEPVVEEKDENLSDKKKKNKEKSIGKYKLVKSVATIGGALATGFFLLAVGGSVIAVAGGVLLGGLAASKISKSIINYSLQKDKKVKKITKIQTRESKLIEENLAKTEKQIDRLLKEPHNNYTLETNKIRYENEIELLKARINLKKSEKVKKGHLTLYKLQLASLEMQLERAMKNYEEITEKIESYNNDSKSPLKNVNEEMLEVQKKLSESKPETSKKTVSIKKLEIRKSVLEKRQKIFAKGFKLIRKPINSVKGTLLRSVDYFKGVGEVIAGNYTPEEDHNSVKTR